MIDKFFIGLLILCIGVAVAILIWLLLIVVGIMHDPHEGEHCVQGHFQPIIVGKVITMIYLCDHYEANNESR